MHMECGCSVRTRRHGIREDMILDVEVGDFREVRETFRWTTEGVGIVRQC